jgi:hypothetical protein
MDPSGKYPIPKVNVYVASGALAPISAGAGTCPTLPATGVTQTGPTGTASLDVATGGLVPVVAQIGKWRAQTMVNVTACSPASAKINLPASSTAGNVPAIAVSTGKSDTLECTIHRLGLDGAVTFFQGAGGVAPTGAAQTSSLWASEQTLLGYDAVIMSCEGAATAGANPTALSSYIGAGGMVYAEHWQYSWFDAAPFTGQNMATWNTGSSFLTGTTNAVIETGSAAGLGFQQWLESRGALDGTHELPMMNAEAANNAATLGSASTLLVAADTSASVPNAPLLFSWSQGGEGRVVYADYHVADSVGDYGTAPGSVTVPAGAAYPTGCLATALQPSEFAFLYALFEDLSCGM